VATPEPDQLAPLAIARAIGAGLCREAIWQDDRCTWTGATLQPCEGQLRLVHAALGADLYQGSSGIGLFLTRLHTVTGERIWREVAQAALRHAVSLSLQHSASAGCGLYTGLAGVAYALMASTDSYGEPQRRQDLAALLDRIARVAPEQLPTGVLSGSAGLIAVLVRWQLPGAAAHARHLAIRLADHLLATARRTSEGWHWPLDSETNGSGQQGFAHGAAGLAWALIELAAATGEGRYRHAACEAARYARRGVNRSHGTLPGEGSSGASAASGSRWPGAWCHGAAGNALAALRCSLLDAAPIWQSDAEQGIATLLEILEDTGGSVAGSTDPDDFALSRHALAGLDASLCHGRAGLADVLLTAARQWRRPELVRWAQRAMQPPAAGAGQLQDWPCGLRGAGAVPGLMLGMAGIGDVHLRMHAPELGSLLAP
jgi:lantibiotic modifying enzyme